MTTLIVREEGVPFVVPSVKERPLDDQPAALRFLEQLEAGEFDMLICTTGVGLTFLRDVIAASMPVERLSAALRKVTIVSRGPKPVGVLRALDVPVHIMIPEPNTWREIVEAVSTSSAQRVAIQEYGRPNAELNAALERLGITVTPIALYRWELPDDVGPLQEASRRLAAGELDVVLFTSSVQLDHLLDVSRGLGLEQRVRAVLASEVVIASIGPVMTGCLAAAGFPVHIVPRQPRMWALVKAAGEQAPGLLATRNGAIRS
jgi:uroporphyrinogen-III synthase